MGYHLHPIPPHPVPNPCMYLHHTYLPTYDAAAPPPACRPVMRRLPSMPAAISSSLPTWNLAALRARNQPEFGTSNLPCAGCSDRAGANKRYISPGQSIPGTSSSSTLPPPNPYDGRDTDYVQTPHPPCPHARGYVPTYYLCTSYAGWMYVRMTMYVHGYVQVGMYVRM